MKYIKLLVILFLLCKIAGMTAGASEFVSPNPDKISPSPRTCSIVTPSLSIPSSYWCMDIDCFSDSACGNRCICVYIDGSVSGVCASHDR